MRDVDDLINDTGRSPKRVCLSVVQEPMFMFINDSSEASEMVQYMFPVPEKKDMDSYVHDRLVRLKSEKKWHFPYVQHETFEGLTGSSGEILVKLEENKKSEDDDAEEENVSESTMVEAFQLFFEKNMKPWNKWPRSGCGKKEIVKMDFMVNYSNL
jgi:hypothetical protein